MLSIVADDLTGALDTAAPFAARGIHTEVAVTIDGIQGALQQNPAVLSVNLGSRDLSMDAAKELTVAALAALPSSARLFKKIDSRLKGNVAAELDVIPFRTAMVALAIPAFGRVVKNAHVQGFGVETPISIAEKLGQHVTRAIIPDIATHGDMRAALDAADAAGVDLLIGARGLAEALAERLSRGAAAQTAEIPGGPALFVIGSRDPITLVQIDTLRSAFGPRYLPAPNGQLSAACIDGSPITLVQAVPGEEAVTSAKVSQGLAESVSPGLTHMSSTLVLSGGATAEAVLKRMGIKRLRLLGECLPGLGLAHVQGHCIIAKSGGFGGPDTLKEIAERLLRKMG